MYGNGDFLVDRGALTRVFTRTPVVRCYGPVSEVSGPLLKASIVGAAVGDLVRIEKRNYAFNDYYEELFGQVVGFQGETSVIFPFGDLEGVFAGASVETLLHPPQIGISSSLLGQIVDPFAKPLSETKEQNSTPLAEREKISIVSPINRPPSPLERHAGISPFLTGVRAIDAFVSMAVGSRFALFAEPGIGKSALLALVAKNPTSDVNVIGLIGERGREVNELFLENLDEETRMKTVLVVSTSDDPAPRRILAALTATRIAEYFRDLGQHVLLEIDSLTRLFRAYREVGLAAGEIPVRGGYPPSVFAFLPRLIERAGGCNVGSITALYTVLTSGGLIEDPMVEEIKSLTDGHIVLSTELAERGQYPAIDILRSVSRVQRKCLSAEFISAVSTLKQFVSGLKQEKEIAAYSTNGEVTNSEHLRKLIALEHTLFNELRQSNNDCADFTETMLRLQALATKIPRISSFLG